MTLKEGFSKAWKVVTRQHPAAATERVTIAADPRLRRHMRRVRRGLPAMLGNLPWYRFEWNEHAWQWYGLRGMSEGLSSADVRRIHPDAVRVHPITGYEHIDWLMIRDFLRARFSKKRTLSPASVGNQTP